MINILLMRYEFQSEWAFETLKEYLKPEMRVAILTMTHGDEIPDGETWLRLYGPGGEIRKILTDAYGAYGIPEEQITFISWFHDTAETAAEKLKNSEIIFMTGGLPDRFYDRVCAWNLVEKLRAYPGIVMGCSAGAMIQMTEYHITPDEDYDTYGYYPGFGLLDGFEPEVHYAGSEIQRESAARYLRERGKPVYAITNDGGLLVDNGVITLMGEVIILQNP